MRIYDLHKAPIVGFEIGLDRHLYVPVNQSMRDSRPFKIKYKDKEMVVSDWEKDSVHEEWFEQRIPGRSGKYAVHYFKWDPLKQEKLPL